MFVFHWNLQLEQNQAFSVSYAHAQIQRNAIWSFGLPKEASTEN